MNETVTSTPPPMSSWRGAKLSTNTFLAFTQVVDISQACISLYIIFVHDE
jgi:hypothetical protein